MAGGISETGAQYSTGVGLIYIFNLIVGTGALTMPKAFQAAGWLLSLITITVLAFMSYLTTTFVTESMGIANAVLRKDKKLIQQHRPSLDGDSYSVNDTDERRPLLYSKFENKRDESSQPHSAFDITERTELGQMASMFFNKAGVLLFNLCIVIYLYGDLSIYAAAVPKSIRDVACTFKLPHNTSNGSHADCNVTLGDSDPCWHGASINRINAYRIFVTVFFVLLGGFTFFNIQKTKYLQFVTSLSRWIAFGMMIILAVIRLSRGQGQGRPAVADIAGMPNLFGVCVYSFMCHHSLPSLVTPIRNKRRFLPLLAVDYSVILVFYAIVSFTGIYAFRELDDIYTLNFLPDPCDEANSITRIKFIQYFLALFPVFTLSTNFPIISITLRNNLKAIGYRESRPYSWGVDRIVFPLLALIPPMAIALATDHVEFLVGVTGSYAGTAIQYVIPALLVYCARKYAATVAEPNVNASPFRGRLWVLFVCIWAAICIGFVTVNHIIEGK